MISNKLIDFLNQKYETYNQPDFIEEDPLQIPHRFSKKQDIEIAGLFAATLAWGQRKTIINKCNDILNRMDNQPFDFVKNSSENDLKGLLGFKHRTFNDIDLLYFVDFLKRVYAQHDSLEDVIFKDTTNVRDGLINLNTFFKDSDNYPQRTGKHLSSPIKGSACKRLNMYFRWMVRTEGVDLGIWTKTSPSELICPMDVHVIRVAKKINLLQREKSDWKAAIELTENLRQLDPKDPVKYDFALFGLGVYEGQDFKLP